MKCHELADRRRQLMAIAVAEAPEIGALAFGQAHAHRQLGGGGHMEDEAPVCCARMKTTIRERMKQPSLVGSDRPPRQGLLSHANRHRFASREAIEILPPGAVCKKSMRPTWY
jgi:hypothetical protein